MAIKSQCLLALAIVSSLMAVSARASSYDAASDFSASYSPSSANPNGVWSYGEYNDGSGVNGGVLNSGDFKLFTDFRNLGPTYPSLQEWFNGDPSTDPNVVYNSSATDVDTTPNFGDILFRSGKLTLGPALGPTVVRFTTPAAGYYDISAAFMTVQQGNTAPNAYVYVGNTQFSLGVVNPDPTSTPYALANTFLSLGEHVDFVVWGGNSANKTTQLDATISSVPLPASMGVSFVMLGGFGMVAALRKRRRHRSRIAG